MEVREGKTQHDTFYPINQDISNINTESPPAISNERLYPNRNELDQDLKTCQHLNLNLWIKAVYYSRRFTSSVYVAPLNDTPLLWTDHWLHLYGFDKQYIETRMHSANEFRSEFLNAKPYKHDYTISCKDCHEVLRVGTYTPPMSILFKILSSLFFVVVIGFIIWGAISTFSS